MKILRGEITCHRLVNLDQLYRMSVILWDSALYPDISLAQGLLKFGSMFVTLAQYGYDSLISQFFRLVNGKLFWARN